MKKIICLLLCLMMLIPVAVSQAYTTIDTISVTLTIPKAGTKADKPPIVSVPSGSLYSVVESSCYWADTNGELPPSAVFEAGKEYYAEIDFYSASDIFVTENLKVTSNVTVVDSYTDQSFAAVLLKFTVPAGSTEKTTLSKLKSVKLTALSAKKLKVSWKKLSSKDQKKIQKIQIQYSTDKTFKTYKTKWAKKGATSVKISGLKKNTKYYIRIRAYKKSGGVIYVSKWVTKNKKTKKK